MNASEPSAFPADLTHHDLVARNKRNSVLLVIGLGLLVLTVAGAISGLLGAYHALDVTGIAVLMGVIVTLFALAVTWSVYFGSSAVMRMSGARLIDKPDDPELFNIVDEMRLAAGLPMPKVYLIDSPALNAFATGRDPEHAAVAITTGLRSQLSRDELTGVMAHEMAHVRHLDIRLTLLVATLVGMIVLMADMMRHSLRFGAVGRSRGSGKGKGAAMVLIIVLLLVLMIVAPVLARIIQAAVSRQREFLADAGAAEMTRYPKGLADALRKLAADHTPLEHANRATAHLYIVNPILNAKGREELNSVFSTHPPISERIARLDALMR